MKIVFTSAITKSPSYMFYALNLAKVNGLVSDVSLNVQTKPKTIDYTQFDVALFMGFDQASSLAKTINPSIITGVIEPRAYQKNTFEYVDFIVANSLESKDFFSKYNKDIILYYSYPEVPAKLDCPIEKNRLILGYHGNPTHLDAMFPRITQAIATMHKEFPIEFWVMYNIKKEGKWQRSVRQNLVFPIIHIQYSDENYARYMAHADIGIIPQFIPVRENRVLRRLVGSLSGSYGERSDNYLLRFKETTNIGRHLVFAQYKIPIVSDMSPSACSFIEDEFNSYVAYSSSGWYRALKKLAKNPELRKTMGQRLYEKYRQTAAIKLLNQRLIAYIKSFTRAY